jgi:Bacterial Ig-like domain (group 3)
MRRLWGRVELRLLSGICVLVAACGGGGVITTPPPEAKITPTVTVTPSATGITCFQTLKVTVAVAKSAGGSTPTGSVSVMGGHYSSGEATLSGGLATVSVPAGSLTAGANTLRASYSPDAASSSAYSGSSGSALVSVTFLSPAVAVMPATPVITSLQPLQVKVSVTKTASGGMPTGSVTVTSGKYSSGATTLSGGDATVTVPAGSLAGGSTTLTAAYSPDAASSSTYSGATGSAVVTVVQAVPAVTVTPASASMAAAEALAVSVTVTASGGGPLPTGSITLTSGTYTSPANALTGGTATISMPGGSLLAGSDVITASYTPDSLSDTTYAPAAGASAAISVLTSVAVDAASPGPAVSDQLLGMNLATWYDVAANAGAINTAFQAAGIKAVRWPGGSWSDDYHWGMNSTAPSICGNTLYNDNTFADFVDTIVKPGGYDLALTANYGDDATCKNPGDPREAAAWITAAVQAGIHVGHMTVGNEEFASWESDHHAIKHDPATYANAVAGVNGYYQLIKAADSTTKVGIDVDAGVTSKVWDSTVLARAKGSYDFVEFHYYAQNPGAEDDAYLVQSAAPDLAKSINVLKAELAAAGVDVPIYIGEIGSVLNNPGKQTTSITQGLYAGQALGEMMNAGIDRLAWWIGFGNCNGAKGNVGSTVYGWQSFGAYNVFSDGSTDTPANSCAGYGPMGTMSPTARAFQLFSNVAVNGETALKATVTGGRTDVRAYAASHGGGTALVLFNLNKTASVPVVAMVPGQAASTDVTVMTYDKAIYDKSNAATPVWADPVTTDMGAQSLPLTLTLTPWSMNVVIVK